METITTYLNALVDMLNNEPPQSILQLKYALEPFIVLGYKYEIDIKVTSEADAMQIEILFKGKGKMYNVDFGVNDLYYFKQVW